MNEEHLFSATLHPYRVCESDPPAGHTAGHLAYIPNTGGRPDRQRWRTLRGACPLSRPALPGHGETMALNIRLRMNCSCLTFPALQRSSLSERERQRAIRAARRRAVCLLSGSDKISPYSGRRSPGRETQPGGRGLLLPDGEQNNAA